MGTDEHFVKADITEAQFYLEEMQKMNNQMINMQRELNRALMESRRMQEELKQNEEARIALEVSEKAGKAKMEFMSRMSHDLRTPMNVIMGLTAATLDEVDHPESVRENMAHIRSASDYMLGLINDILDMAKTEKDAVVLKSEPYSYNEFLMEMATLFQAQCTAKNITLEIKKPSRNPIVMTDKQRLKQIFFNIISNAVTYTPPGGTIRMGAYDVRIDDAQKKISAVYRVEDNGIGMSEAFKEHIFEPFVQEDNGVSPELKGSGLGLSITKRLLEQMGGTIQIESQKGKGTTVSVELSFDLAAKGQSKTPKAGAQREQNYAEQTFAGKNILLAEDHPLNAQVAQRLLEKKKINVIHAENGKVAVELFAASPAGGFDAVLMDIRMPEMSGLEAASAIRSMDRADAATIPIIAISANAYPKDVQESLNAGMNAHLAKPIKPAELYEALKKFM
ncbi:MAG: ATP-binding protein [Lachnospiraceae bacterium]|nr:ATP-binding protein [Lachnospiraceae bacterium]